MACSSFLSDEDLRRFRTKPCRRNLNKSCEFGADRCQYSHNVQWARRCPFYLTDQNAIRYIPKMCPHIIVSICENVNESNMGTVVSNKCSNGGSCPYAHSLEEYFFHPLVYKTRLCIDFFTGVCKRYYCPFVHGTAETRDIFSMNLTLPYKDDSCIQFMKENYPNVLILPRECKYSGMPFSRSSSPQMKDESGITVKKTAPIEYAYDQSSAQNNAIFLQGSAAGVDPIQNPQRIAVAKSVAFQNLCGTKMSSQTSPNSSYCFNYEQIAQPIEKTSVATPASGQSPVNFKHSDFPSTQDPPFVYSQHCEPLAHPVIANFQTTIDSNHTQQQERMLAKTLEFLLHKLKHSQTETRFYPNMQGLDDMLPFSSV